jgi:hypothetical protein
MPVITGEKIQELCEIYLGFNEDFQYNKRIASCVERCKDIKSINSSWSNPKYIFCYSKRIENFLSIMHYLQNQYVLITHNSDKNITDIHLKAFESDKLLFWHAQNVCVNHVKLGCLPIGIANSMWQHGNLDVLQSIQRLEIPKTNDIYFYFSLHTNKLERTDCLTKLQQKGLVFMKNLPFEKYLAELASYKYAICPPGNGVDSHRIWECLYLGVKPILLRSVFTERLSSMFDCVLVNDWTHLDIDDLVSSYSGFNIRDLSLDRVNDCIKSNYRFY